MPLTKTDLINRAYAKVTLSREAPPSDDAAVIEADMNVRLADLSVRIGFQEPDPADIPEEAFLHLVTILAEDIAPQFGGRAKDEAVIRYAEQLLRSQDPSPRRSAVRSEYF